MAEMRLHRFFDGFALVLLSVLVVCSFVCSCSQTGKQAAAAPRYKVVAPGTHPGLLFSAEELPGLRRRAKGETLAAEAYRRVLEQANAPEGEGGGPRGGRGGGSQGLMAKALVYQIEGDREMGRKAVEQMIRVVREVDPEQFLLSNYDPLSHGRYPIMLGFAWDWLYPVMEDSERVVILAGIENWCEKLFEHTEKQWWRDASYNCGAIPVGALGIACVAIRGESKNPELEKWLDSAILRIWRNYYPTAWRENGICYEGPCYAQYQMDPTKFGEALRRTGGPDILTGSGAINAMVYQRFQWMPHGGCSPIGDNTEYGRRVFAAPYLLGIGEMADRPGLWTFVNYTDQRRLDPIITFLWFPDDLEPVSPAEANLPTSGYFEITRNRAGYLFARSAWADEQAAAFAFVTRYEDCNHQHYDMSSFLFSAFGREWATHRNIYGYRHPDHGADIEHNLVVVDTGGMPVNDRPSSAGDDCSLFGLLTGLGTGHFADYVRGDAKLSYQDRSDPETLPADRADRYCVFAKQGPLPYVLVVDDIQKSEQDHDYHWQWYTPDTTVSGSGTLSDPILLGGDSAVCSIHFLQPSRPQIDFQVIGGEGARPRRGPGLIRASQRGSRVRYVVLAAARKKDSPQPVVAEGPAVQGNPAAVSLLVKTESFTDLIVWQPEELTKNNGGNELINCGPLSTDGFLALVRTNAQGEVIGYVLGDGTLLKFGPQTLAQGVAPLCVSADRLQVHALGKRMARENLPPVPASGKLWLPAPQAAVFVDNHEFAPSKQVGKMVVVGQ